MTRRHPVNREHVDQATFAQRAAEVTALWIGSWRFLGLQALFFAVWFAVNSIGFWRHWDPYPWLLANIVLSCQAAVTGPILLIAANRSAAHDRAIADATYTDTELLKELLQTNTTLTEHVDGLAQELHAHILGTRPA